jgi:hypothetical protein
MTSEQLESRHTADNEALRLVTAYMAISEPDFRRDVLELAEHYQSVSRHEAAGTSVQPVD